MHKIDRNYIGGEWVSSRSKHTHTMINQATELGAGTVVLADENDVDAAIAAARSAFSDWASRDRNERSDLVRRIQKIYEERVEDMAQAISREMGAPIDLARKRQTPAALRHISAFLDAFENFEFLRPLGENAPDNRIIYEPIGVVGLITPWNWPMSQIALKVIPALLAGCTVVLKPSEFAPLSASLLAEIIDAAQAPAGVFNLIQGDGKVAGTRLVSHPDVAMISFTGSAAAGATVIRASADSFKRVALELGGKGANLVFADADDDAVARGVRQCFVNSGQNCNAPSRLLVEESFYTQAVEIAAHVAASISIGLPDEEGDHIGPVVSERQYLRIQSLIDAGTAAGARLVAGGGGRPTGFNRGFFVRPTVFADVSNDMPISREEIFGPVLSILPFKNEEEAVRIANDTPYGLTNYVQSSDTERRQRLARRLRSGMVEMNGRPRGTGAPFGGVGHSGDAREGGIWGLEEFMYVKSVSAWV